MMRTRHNYRDKSIGARTIQSFCTDYQLGKSFVYEAIRAGLLTVKYAGTKPLILHEEGERFISSLPGEPLPKAERIKAWGLDK